MKYHKGLVYNKVSGNKGSVLLCTGLASNMNGSKGSALYEFCSSNDVALTRFDYSGHGASEGELSEGCISKWLEDSLVVLHDLTQGEQIIVGSSMGAWIAILIALRYPKRVKALVCVAAAPDFTQDIYNTMSQDQIELVKKQGYIHIPSSVEGQPYLITNKLLVDGGKNLILDKEVISITCPITLLHSLDDDVVDYKKSLKIAQKVQSEDVLVKLTKKGQHFMNDTRSLALLYKSIKSYI